MPEPVRTTVFGLIVIGFILSLIGLVTPFWGTGIMTKLDAEKGVVENLVNNWESPNFVRASIWNSHEWWPEVSATGNQLKPSGELTEAKVTAIFAILLAVVALVLQAVYTFNASLHLSKVWAVLSGCTQTSAGILCGIVCAIMAGCLTNKMATNPLFRLGDSFILTVIGAILLSVCGLFTLFHFVYSVKELALDKKLLLMYPEMFAAEEPQQYGGGMPGEAFPTSTSIAPHLASPSQEFPA